MTVRLELISGIVFGIEIVPEYQAAMIDLGIVRIFFDWMDESDVDIDD